MARVNAPATSPVGLQLFVILKFNAALRVRHPLYIFSRIHILLPPAAPPLRAVVLLRFTLAPPLRVTGRFVGRLFAQQATTKLLRCRRRTSVKRVVRTHVLLLCSRPDERNTLGDFGSVDGRGSYDDNSWLAERIFGGKI